MTTQARAGPWFRRRPGLTVAVGAALLLTVALLGVVLDDASVSVAMLYALPVSLVAMGCGRAGGIGTGLVAAGLVVVGVAGTSEALSWLAWLSQTVPVVMVGALLGDASERLARAEESRSRLEGRELRHRQAVEINDNLIQGMAAAKWSMEAGRVDAALVALEETLDRGQRLVSQLITDAERR
ncbi:MULTISPECIES: hypothetical protein [unclassified Serinicoccus]|uniref:hypothetical protein n=1 Tax=unclassified Serinicoccus TaxID=2643101 RepID=UPI003853842C